MNGLEADYGTQINFIRLNAAQPDNEAYQQTLGLRGHPTVAVLAADGGAEATFFGPQSAETLRVAIETVLSRGES